jgi:hypothetical protein
MRRENLMKRLFQMVSLACAIVLLSACPDAKLPSPAPKVPEPKAQGTAALPELPPPGLQHGSRA